MKDDKTKIKNWIEGDTFAVKIENHSEEYNGRYLIFIKHIPEDENNYCQCFYVKITEKQKIPTTREEIDKLDFIKNTVVFYDKETVNYMHFGENYDSCIPDNYNYVYQYFCEIYFYKKSGLDKFKYLGNFNLKRPINEITSRRQIFGRATKFEWINPVVDNYINNNLHQGWEFQPSGFAKMKEAYFMFYNMRRNADKMMESIENKPSPKYSFGWGTSLYDSDIALDVKGSYVDVYKKNKSYEEIIDELKKTIGDYLSDELDGPISWIIIADQEMKRKRLNPELKNIAYKSIEKDLKNWENNELYDERKKVLDKFRNKLDNFKETN